MEQGLHAKNDHRFLDDVIDELGYGQAQHIISLVGPAFEMLASASKMLLPFCAVSVGADWHLTHIQIGTVTSTLYVGQLLGNFIAGIVCDAVGRKVGLLASLLVSTFAMLGFATLSYNFASLVFWLTLLGFTLAIGTTAWNTYQVEMVPSDSRLFMNVVNFAPGLIGSVYATSLAWSQDPQLVDLNWRRLVICAALPGPILFVLTCLTIPESLRFLDIRNRRQEAVAVLDRMRALNGKHHVDIENWTTGELAVDEGLAQVWSKRLWFTTLTLCFSAVLLNYAQYGLTYAMPQILPEAALGITPAATLLIVHLMTIPSAIITYLFGSSVSRKSVLMFYLLSLSASIIVFAVCIDDGGQAREGAHPMVTQLALQAIAISLGIGWVFTYMYASEVFPTSCRASGVGMVMSCGRIGSIITPFGYELFGTMMFFRIIVVMAVINIGMVAMLPLETKDKQLTAISAEGQSLVNAAKFNSPSYGGNAFH